MTFGDEAGDESSLSVVETPSWTELEGETTFGGTVS